MKKHLKKLVLLSGYFAITTLALAGNLSYIRIDCGDGRGTNLIMSEDVSLDEKLEMAKELKEAFCN
ncbi:hypothetical protein [Carboxylicivirga caseinilyticus]|uniref:hypothetical protein n=1 Tax=Carboxylicivirga caseinilyticus TaxID=3417572 RepID=UPI003D32E7C1|nr:hypothetical protein [Marinilabiliaceae bacterium A049]